MKKEINIMIVEDELIFAEDLKTIFQDPPYKVSSIQMRANDALAEIARKKPDLILIDIKLQGKMDGIELSEKVRQKYAIPVIFITAFSNPLIIEKSMATKPICYLIKPISELDLLDAIKAEFEKD